MHAADVMTPDVVSATPETPLAELVRLMLDNRISALPIVDGGHIVGIVSEGDLLRRAEAGAEPRPSRWLELVTSTDRMAADYTRSHGRKAGEIMTHRSPKSRTCSNQSISSVCRSLATASWLALSAGATCCRHWPPRYRRLRVRPTTGPSAMPSIPSCGITPGRVARVQ